MTDKTTEEAWKFDPPNQELFDLIESVTGKVLVQSELDDIIRVVMKTAAIQSPAADEVAAAWKALDLWMFGDGKIPTPKQYMALKDAVTRSTLQTPAVNAEVLGKVREALEFYAAPFDVVSSQPEWTTLTLREYPIKAQEALRLLSTLYPYNTKDYVQLTPGPRQRTLSLKTATDELIDRFADALKEKLNKAREKYGYQGEEWSKRECVEGMREELHKHLRKGDPRDVAAYCAFLWHHGESTDPIDGAPLSDAPVKGGE